MIRAVSRRHPENLAIQSAHDSITYRELAARMEKAAGGLEAAGLQPGDRLVIFMENSIEWVITYLAAARLGAVIVPINVLASDTEVLGILDETEARIIVSTRDRCNHFRRQRQRITFFATDPAAAGTTPNAEVNDWEWLLAHDECSFEPPKRSDPVTLYYGSGTTGQSKAAVHTHGNIVGNAVQQIIDLGIGEPDRYLATQSMSWASGLQGISMAALFVGGTVVLPELGALTAEKLAAAIRDWDPTIIALIPTLLRRIVQSDEATEVIRRSRLRLMMTGAEPVPLHLFERVSDLFPDVAIMQAYGMSEFPLLVAVLRPEEARLREGSAGRAASGVEMAILDDGSVRTYGSGEIIIRSPVTTCGYWMRPLENESAFMDGWFRTGDLGQIDEEGFLWITGRLKDLIITGGLNVSPVEVEEVLQAALGGREVAVVGIPDEDFGEKIVAVVAGPEPFDAEWLQTKCREVLPSYKTPRTYLSWPDELPKGLTGKLLRRELQPWVIDNVAEKPPVGS